MPHPHTHGPHSCQPTHAQFLLTSLPLLLTIHCMMGGTISVTHDLVHRCVGLKGSAKGGHNSLARRSLTNPQFHQHCAPSPTPTAFPNLSPAAQVDPRVYLRGPPPPPLMRTLSPGLDLDRRISMVPGRRSACTQIRHTHVVCAETAHIHGST